MRAVLVICAVTTRPSWATCASISTTRSCASLAPAGGFQQRSICAFTTSISLVVSCGPSGATGCDDAFACCWGAVVGFGGVSVFCDSARFERFFRNESNCCSSCFFLLGSGGGTGLGGGGGGGAGFGGSGGGGFGVGAGAGGGGGAGGCSALGGSGCACATCGGGTGVGGGAAEGGGAGGGGTGFGGCFGGVGGASTFSSAGLAWGFGGVWLGRVARVSGAMFTSSTAIGVSSSGCGGNSRSQRWKYASPKTAACRMVE